jgi:ribosomal protein S12 methylthiotransferase accessory factor
MTVRATLRAAALENATAVSGPFGAVGPARRVKSDGWMPPKCAVYAAWVGDRVAMEGAPAWNSETIIGSGRAYGDPEHAQLVAISEALERMAFSAIDRPFVFASAAELGEDAMDLDLVPRCSAREIRQSHHLAVRADKSKPIRWTLAVDLLATREVLIPANMAYLLPSCPPPERFWLPISTGAAAHTSIEAALVNGICEVVERDAIALTWLQRLPLPRLSDECISDDAREVIDWCSDHGIRTHLFDATTDLDIPVVYCVQTTQNPRVSQLVACAADLDVRSAVLRALLEVMSNRLGLCSRKDQPRRYTDFRSATDGAAVMSRQSRRPVFAFLLDGFSDRPATRPASRHFASDADRLAFLLRCLAERDMSVFAADLSTREIDEAGYVVVHVVIPQLQPMSLQPLVQYRAHSRVYDAPRKMGMRVLPERQLNPYPQPIP